MLSFSSFSKHGLVASHYRQDYWTNPVQYQYPTDSRPVLLQCLSRSDDGNYCVVDALGRSVWCSDSTAIEGSALSIQDSGEIVITDASGTAVWQCSEDLKLNSTQLCDLSSDVFVSAPGTSYCFHI